MGVKAQGSPAGGEGKVEGKPFVQVLCGGVGGVSYAERWRRIVKPTLRFGRIHTNRRLAADTSAKLTKEIPATRTEVTDFIYQKARQLTRKKQKYTVMATLICFTVGFFYLLYVQGRVQAVQRATSDLVKLVEDRLQYEQYRTDGSC